MPIECNEVQPAPNKDTGYLTDGAPPEVNKATGMYIGRNPA
jgi:hypothetical protein